MKHVLFIGKLTILILKNTDKRKFPYIKQSQKVVKKENFNQGLKTKYEQAIPGHVLMSENNRLGNYLK